MANQGPIKVSAETKEKVRLGAVMLGNTQSEFVDMAVAEYIGRHAEDLVLGLKHARQALLDGNAGAIAYLLEEDPEEVKKVIGSGSGPSP